jgi:hypothetical protein
MPNTITSSNKANIIENNSFPIAAGGNAINLLEISIDNLIRWKYGNR